MDSVAHRYALISDGVRPGGQSVVHKALDTTDGTFVAVKRLNGSDDELLHKVFQRETSILKSLDHPNIIRLLDSGIDDDGGFFLVFDWVEQSFADALLRTDPFEWNDLATTIAKPLLSALSYAHLKGAEHRDVKPGNVLLRDDGTPLLADFGIAKLRSDMGHSELTMAGFRSRPYAPPEEDSAVPYVRDVYSVGVLLLQALSKEKIRDFSDIAPALDVVNVPAQVRHLLGACVNPDRARRPANGDILFAEFTKVTRAANQDVARTPVVHLGLTRKAQEQLSKELGVGIERAGTNLEQDLASEVFAEFRLDRETGNVDRDTIMLTGNSWRLTAKVASNRKNLVIVSARTHDFEVLESIRRRSLSLTNIVEWSCSSPRDIFASVLAIDKLIRALDDHEEARHQLRGPKVQTSTDSLFDSWMRLLQAREEVARGDLQPLRYSAHHLRGREADFTLYGETETDLIGTEMEVVIEESGKRLARGEVIAQGDGEITLRSGRSFPRLPGRGLLTPFLGPSQIAIQRQRDAVSAIKDGTASRTDLSSIILDPSSIRSPRQLNVTSWFSDLDDSKQAAVEAALGSDDLVLVQGPPGTGKTTFITETVAQLLKRRPSARVLIVSQTHVAVDNALERLDAAGVSRVVRLGSGDESRVDARVRHLLLDHQMGKWAHSLRQKAERYLGEKATEAGLSSEYLQAALALRQAVTLATQIESLEEKLGSDTDSRSPGPEADEIIDDGSLQGRLDRLVKQRVGLISEVEGYLAGDLTIGSNMSKTDMEAAIEILIGRAGAGPGLLRILTLQAEWLQRVASDENLASSFLQTSNVIAGTCIGFLRHPAVRELEIDLCILDEASKAAATEALVPMARAKRWILIGDSNQLPPMDEEVLRLPELLDEYDLDPEFVRETLFLRLANEVPDHSNFLLREQYRMIRPIGDLISSCFYKGNLNSPRTTGIRGYDFLSKPVLWIDTISLNKLRREDPQSGGTSYSNRGEANVVISRLKVIDGAIGKGLVGDRDRQVHVLLVAPYRSQVEELARRLSSASLSYLTVEVQSVDAVQGRESDLAIFSVTRSNSLGQMGFLGEDYWRRINVALSRARFGLTIIGDAEFCSTSPGALRQVLRYMKNNPPDCEIRLA